MKTRLGCSLGVVAALFVAGCDTIGKPNLAGGRSNDLAMQSLPEIAGQIRDGAISSEAATRAYLDRIEAVDRRGPNLQSVLAINPNAIEDARALDRELAQGRIRGPLHGVPVLLKDNIETRDPLPTTAGAVALRDNLTRRDAPLAAGLRNAGAVILGKANLSEWANFRGADSISGWSALGGQVRNPHMLDRSPCGSSSGSGAAAAASLAAGAVGTETNGSIICPASMNGVVGFKPTVGLVSQQYIVPISSTQDTAGPMTRTVRGAALMLSAMATVEGGTPPDFAASLDENVLAGRRVGVLRFAQSDNPAVVALFEAALEDLAAAGAILVDIDEFERPAVFPGESLVLRAEFKATLNAYLADSPADLPVRTLQELIEFTEAHADEELVLFGQETHIGSQALGPLTDPEYAEALAEIINATGTEGIDKLLTDHDVDVLVSPSNTPAFMIDAVNGDSFGGGAGIGWMAAISGYPHLTVPMGAYRALPIGLSFIGAAGEDASILAAGYAYEQHSHRRVEPEFLPDAEAIADVRRAMVGLHRQPTN